MATLPLFCAILLAGCSETIANRPQSLYDAPQWPDRVAIANDPSSTQKDVAKWAVRAEIAFNQCVANLDGLKKLDNSK